MIRLQQPSQRPRVPRPRRRSGRRGVALVMVLGALTILAVMLTEVQDEASAELGAALADRDAVKAEYAARSAVSLGRLLIAAEPTIRAGVAPIAALMFGGSVPQIPVWEHAGMMLGAFNDEESVKSFATLSGLDATLGKNLGLPGASFEITIVDEDSKLNLNLAARASAASKKSAGDQLMALIAGQQYDDLFELKDEDGNYQQRGTICSALVDWADPDTDTEVCGTEEGAQSAAAEDNYYERLDKPFERKNAAYDSVEELHLIRGVGDEFWSTFIDPDPEDPSKRNVTVWGQEKININTANPYTLLTQVCKVADNETEGLQPLCGGDPNQPVMFLMGMGILKNVAKGVPFFSKPDVFVKAIQGQSRNPMVKSLFDSFGILPVKLRSEAVLKDALGTESKIFSIYATGRVKGVKRETSVRVHAVVDFRAAPPPGQPRNMDELAGDLASALGQGASNAGAGSPPTPSIPGLPDGATADSIVEALRKSPGGEIIYYRLD